MKEEFHFKMKLLARLVLGSVFATGVHAAFAQDAVDLGTVQSGSGSTQSQQSAPYQAPTQGSLVSTQPQSIISQNFIQNNASAASNYTDIINIAPSVSSVDPNGPGLMESPSVTMRGFEDGQFNMTIDGIPWGDSNDFTHHSTSYISNQDIGNIVVDRGPGDASNVGVTTFGGTIAIQSKNPTATPGFTPYATFGSFNTRLLGAEFNTGVMQNYGDVSAFVDYKDLNSDGFLTYAGVRRQNIFVKAVNPVSADTVVSFVAMKNAIHQYTTGNNGGTSLALIQQYGYNYGLNANPATQNFYGYNYDDITSDMEYVDIKTRQGSWKINNKLYTYAYYHNGYQSNNAGFTAQAPDLAGGHVGGTGMYMNYRSWGDIVKASTPMASGEVDVGAWVDRQTNGRAQWNMDMTTGQNLGGYGRLMTDTLTTIQPYGQYKWHVTSALTVTPGVKYSSFSRSFDAPIMPGTGGGSYYGSATYSKLLPSLDAHYKIQPNWSAYAQYAQGFLAPVMQEFQVANVNPDTIKPTETNNFQLGTTWKDQRLTLSGDVYEIVSKNWMQQSGTQNGLAVYSNAGNVDFSGAEAEATYYVGSGFSLYGNDAIINYNVKNPALFTNAVVGGNTYNFGSILNNVPKNTMAAGVIYNEGPLYASMIAKETGQRYSGMSADGVNPNHFGAYTIANFNANYTLKHDGYWFKDLKIGFQINNLFNKQTLYASGGNGTANEPLYYVTPTRNYQLSLSGSM